MALNVSVVVPERETARSNERPRGMALGKSHTSEEGKARVGVSVQWVRVLAAHWAK
jgi:hypothetical protein